MDEIIENYAKTKLTLVLKLLIDEYGDLNPELLEPLAIDILGDTANELKIELISNEDVMKVSCINEINHTVKMVHDTFIKEILNN